MAARNLPPFARWPLAFFASPACIFHSVSPPAWLFQRWRRGICLLLPAGRCRSSPRRRAFFYSVSPPAWLFRRWRRGICLLLHAGRCRCSPRRRAFFILFLRRRDRFDDGGEEFASFCPLAAAVLRFAGVHFLSRFSAGPGVSTLPAGILPPFYTLVSAFLRFAGVHFSSRFSAGMIVLTMAARNLSPFCPLAAVVLHLAGVQKGAVGK